MNSVKGKNEFKKMLRGIRYKNFCQKNKYFFNELYKNKTMPKDEIICIVNQLRNHECENEKDEKLKTIAEEFYKYHNELFEENDEENCVENVSENDEENCVENVSENDTENLDEKIETIKEEVETIQTIADEHPNFKYIEEFNTRIGKLTDDIEKKFQDMIDSHLDLKRSIEQKRNITDRDAKARIENIEDKLEMLYGRESEIKPKPIFKKPKNTKTDAINNYVNFKLNS